MAGNPWQVESILAFYCLKCPECEFNSKEENNFIHHAKEYHPLSCNLFDQETSNCAPYYYDKEVINTGHIKQEQNSDLSYEEDYHNYPDMSINKYENEDNEGIEIKREFTDNNDPLMANQYENESNEGIEIKTEFTDENDPLKASSFEQSIIYDSEGLNSNCFILIQFPSAKIISSYEPSTTLFN